MKYLKLLIIVLSLSVPIHSYACWENDWDDDDDSGWYDGWGDNDDDLWGGMLPEVDVYPDSDFDDDDWEEDDDTGRQVMYEYHNDKEDKKLFEFLVILYLIHQ